MATTTKAVASTLGVILASVSITLAPIASAANMRVGNYEVATDRWNDHSWVWSVAHSCGEADCATYFVDPIVPATVTDDLNVIAIPRPPKSQRFQNTAFYANGRYTLTVDVIDGVRCAGYNLPSHDVYDWDGATLAGTITSTFDAGCYGAPGGTNTYGFSLNRF